MISKKWVVLLVCVLLGVPVVLMLFAPSILSTNWGKKNIERILNRNISGKLEMESLAFSWFGPQTISGCNLLDSSGKKVISFDSLTTESSFFNFLRGNIRLHQSSLRNLQASITQERSGRTNLEETLGRDLFPSSFKTDMPIAMRDINISLYPTDRGEIALSAEGTTQQGGISGRFDIHLDNQNGKRRWEADINHFPVAILDALLTTSNHDLSGLIPAIFGEALNLRIHEESVGEATTYALKANSPLIKIDLAGKVQEGNLILKTPGKAVFTLSPEGFEWIQRLAGSSTYQWTQAGSSPMELEIKELNLPLALLNSESPFTSPLRLAAEFTWPEFSINSPDGDHMTLKAFNIDLNALSKNLRFRTEGIFIINGHSIPFAFTAESLLNNPQQWAEALVQPHAVTLSLPHVSTGSLDALLGTDGTCSYLFGPTLTFQMGSIPGDSHSINMRLISEKIEIPECTLKVNQAFRLGEQWLSKRYSGEFLADAVSFKIGDRASSINSIRIPWAIQNGAEQVVLSFSAQTKSSLSQQQGAMKGSIDAQLNPSRFSIALSMEGTRIPSPFLTLLTGRNEWNPVFGSELNLNLKAQLMNFNGPLDLEVEGNKGRLQLHGQLANGTLTLLKPLFLETEPSEELGKQVLSEFLPVFGELISGEQPFQITVKPDNFSFPLFPYALERMQVGQAVIDMGRTQFYNAGEIRKLLNGLRAQGPNQVSVWTTPLYLNIDKGIISIYRMDMLVLDRYPLAMWGKIDLPQDRVNMVIGITGSALAAAFGLEASQSDSAMMLQIPVTGSTSNTKIDSSKAWKKVGPLLAKQNGPEGMVLGTVLGTVLDLANGRESPPPPPTTQPLPWEGLSREEPQQLTNPSQPKQTTENPIRGIRREASKLLKNFF